MIDDDEVLFVAERKAQDIYVRFLIADLRSYLQTKAYNPDQPRDDHGRWTSEGGSTGKTGGQDHGGRVRIAANDDDWTRGLGVDPNAFNPPNYAYGSKYSPDLRGWHDYIAGPNIVCTAQQQCTSTQMADYLSRFAVPGQNPNYPVTDNMVSVVFFPNAIIPAGEVVTTVSDSGLTVRNTTLWDHVLYDGVAIRSVTQNPDGSWSITTHGFGNDIFPFMGEANQYYGPFIFDTVDGQMRDYIARNHGTQKSAARLIHIARSGLGTYPGLPLRTRPGTGGTGHGIV